VSSNGSAQCSACLPGSFSSGTACLGCLQAATCSSCPAGRYSGAPSQSTCSTCAAGSVSGAGSSTCTTCLPGQYSNGSVSCLSCSAGRWSARLGQPSAQCEGPCIAGYWCADGATTPKQFACNTPAVYCPEGSPTPTSVGIGNFSKLNNSVQEPCPPSAFCQSGLQTPCRRGSYSNVSGVTECSLCEPGRFSGSIGASSCPLCPRGTASSLAGVSVCASCFQGRFSDTEGATVCELCTPGTYMDGLNATACLTCPTGRRSNEGSLKCDSCQSDQVRCLFLCRRRVIIFADTSFPSTVPYHRWTESNSLCELHTKCSVHWRGDPPGSWVLVSV
jgi:syndecan 4